MAGQPVQARAEARIAVGPSKIEGRGVFATAAISTGSRITQYTGTRLRRGTAVADDRYLLAIDAETWLDAGGSGGEARFINHGCEPNCELLLESGLLQVCATREIEPGEELLIDYGYRPVEALSHPCACGASTCCGYIVGRPWRGAWLRLRSQLIRGRRMKG